MTSKVLEQVLWTEKYRPQELTAIALEPENRQILESYLDAGEIPHLLFVGPPGSGKTTVARLLINAIDCSRMTLNASAERGIDTIRAKIGQFVQAARHTRWNVVFLDEADAMTPDAQTALRNLMESYSERSRFVLTANYGPKIIPPIQSRCQVLAFGPPPLKERYRILCEVLKSEKISFDPKVAFAYANRSTDLRRLLFSVQKAILRGDRESLPPLAEAATASGESMFTALRLKQWTTFTDLTKSGGFDPQQALRDLFWTIPDDDLHAGRLRHILAKAVHETGFTPDPVILFLGAVAECMEL